MGVCARRSTGEMRQTTVIDLPNALRTRRTTTKALYHDHLHERIGKCGGMTDDQDDSFNASKAEIFEALGHPTRIRIVQELSGKPLAFSELKRAARLESNGLLTFHLGKLKDLVKLNHEGAYALTDEGREALRLIQTVHETDPMQVSRAGGSRLISMLPLLLIAPIGLIAVISLILQVPDFFNPCLKWGMASGGSIFVSSASPCSIAGGTSETMLQAALRLALVQGGICACHRPRRRRIPPLSSSSGDRCLGHPGIRVDSVCFRWVVCVPPYRCGISSLDQENIDPSEEPSRISRNQPRLGQV